MESDAQSDVVEPPSPASIGIHSPPSLASSTSDGIHCYDSPEHSEALEPSLKFLDSQQIKNTSFNASKGVWEVTIQIELQSVEGRNYSKVVTDIYEALGQFVDLTCKLAQHIIDVDILDSIERVSHKFGELHPAIIDIHDKIIEHEVRKAETIWPRIGAAYNKFITLVDYAHTTLELLVERHPAEAARLNVVDVKDHITRHILEAAQRDLIGDRLSVDVHALIDGQVDWTDTFRRNPPKLLDIFKIENIMGK
jgi:hypothetical protein